MCQNLFHNDLRGFNLQGLEKLKDITKNSYFKQTNHQNKHFFRQQIEKKNRMELNLFDISYREINSKISQQEEKNENAVLIIYCIFMYLNSN